MDLYLPKPGDKLTELLAWQWYSNISFEVADGFLDKEQRLYMTSYYDEAGLLRRWRSFFFRHHYAKTFAAALTFLLSVPKKQPVILDLGCGSGTQSLAFALFGAKVISLDMDDLALNILRRRKDFYERKTGRTLDIQIKNADVFTFNYASIAPIDGVYSLFAFNMMQPSKKLISLIAPHMSKESSIAILDGNRSFWASRFFSWRRRNTMSPTELENDFRQYGYTIIDHYGGVIFPPPLWCCLPYALLSRVDGWLGCRSWLFPVSHQILAGRR